MDYFEMAEINLVQQPSRSPDFYPHSNMQWTLQIEESSVYNNLFKNLLHFDMSLTWPGIRYSRGCTPLNQIHTQAHNAHLRSSIHHKLGYLCQNELKFGSFAYTPLKSNHKISFTECSDFFVTQYSYIDKRNIILCSYTYFVLDSG